MSESTPTSWHRSDADVIAHQRKARRSATQNRHQHKAACHCGHNGSADSPSSPCGIALHDGEKRREGHTIFIPPPFLPLFLSTASSAKLPLDIHPFPPPACCLPSNNTPPGGGDGATVSLVFSSFFPLFFFYFFFRLIARPSADVSRFVYLRFDSHGLSELDCLFSLPTYFPLSLWNHLVLASPFSFVSQILSEKHRLQNSNVRPPFLLSPL